MNIFVFGDSHECSDEDLYLAADEARYHGCKTMIHTGDMIDEHLGHPAFKRVQISVFLTSLNEHVPEVLPKNWHLLKAKVACIARVDDTDFYVNHYLGLEVLRVKDTEVLDHSTEAAIYKVNSEIRAEYGYVPYVLFGHSHHIFCHCDGGTVMLNPGEWETKKNFVIIKIRPSHAMNFEFFSLTVNQKLVENGKRRYPFWIRRLLCRE